jgi:hypothetical protein
MHIEDDYGTWDCAKTMSTTNHYLVLENESLRRVHYRATTGKYCNEIKLNKKLVYA